jgi:acetyl esterase/lipase
MPIGYLVTTAVVAWCTAFALRPPMPRRSSTSNATYWFTFLANELPFIAFAWLVASTALALAQDDLFTPVGLVGLAVAVLASVGLGLVARRALPARAALARALDAELGLEPAPRRRPSARSLLWPFVVRPRDIERIADVPYGDAAAHRLDVYRHRSRPTGAPVLVHLHGGSFRRGKKSRETRPLLFRLARRGWVCVSANYRLFPEARFPDAHVDVKRVIAWAREHAAEHGGDPTRVLVAGGSAGGNLAVFAALTPNDPAYQPGFEHVDTEVLAAISLYGYYGPSDSREPSSAPAAHLRSDVPPCFLVHGDRDTLVIAEDARAFAARLRSASDGAVVYAELPHAQHTFDLVHSVRCEAVVDAAEAFAEWAASRRPG